MSYLIGYCILSKFVVYSEKFIERMWIIMDENNEKKKKKSTPKKKGKVRAKSEFFRTARYGLTLQEYRIIYYAILKNQKRKTNWETVTISVQEFKKLFELSSHNYYGQLNIIAKNLASKVVEVKEIDGNVKRYTAYPWLSEIHYELKDDEGFIRIDLNQKLREFFEGKPFTETEFCYLLFFKSQYSQRLYEIIKASSWRNKLLDFDIDDLRLKLDIKKTQYPNYSDFKKRVLSPAVLDINENTDIDVEITEKKGKHGKVKTVFFMIHRKENLPDLENGLQKLFEPNQESTNN